ncbi:DUF72 domain-containing protein [Rhizobium sp. YIM 134829]|uniref:DUF72 domain-containing protein n=1 Tax=Rhizobium sp. YIM 134829 TaxID=3390453 RepID=UPI00397C2B17
MPIIATAAWSINKTLAGHFPAEGSGLQRYATVFSGVEVNSTFYGSHKPSTYARWAGSVPDDFRFALKLPQAITHKRRLVDCEALFTAFLAEIAPLGPKIGPLLCQLPPSLAFDRAVIDPALAMMRRFHDGPLVIEVRHRSWQDPDALDLLAAYGIERVLADPAPVWPAESFAVPPAYVRLHGVPKIYYSAYEPAALERFGALLAPGSWCVFDNTASGAALADALALKALLERRGETGAPRAG